MSDSPFAERTKNTHELSMRIVLEEDFKAVCVTGPWSGLTFI